MDDGNLELAIRIMAQLPLYRLKTSLRSFSKTSVVFGGPFITKQGQNRRREKQYFCLFTCLATRAVHLEIAFGLDTPSTEWQVAEGFKKRCSPTMKQLLKGRISSFKR